MSTLQATDWKSKCKKKLEKDFIQCEKALNGDFFDATQRSVEMQIARRISSALERFEQGYWGICEMCKKPIEQKRLIAQPCVEHCIGCQEKLEKQNRFRVSYPVLTFRCA
jgi:RNA polymerase-binding transcription factor DksA